MKVPPEITFRGVEKTAGLEALVQEKIAKLEEVCNYISSCHIAIEKPNESTSNGSPYRVRVDITVPPGHELVAESKPGEGPQYDAGEIAIRDAFRAGRRHRRQLSA